MKRHLGLIILAGLAMILLLLGIITFTVSSTDIVLVKRFGKTVRVLDGRDPKDAGLHWKVIYPVEEIVRYDGKTDIFEDASKEISTRDKQTILLNMYCAWRIDDAKTFQKKIKTVQAARDHIRRRFQAKQLSVVGNYDMRDFVNTNPKEMKLAKIESDILAGLREEVQDEYGVEIVRVGIKSLKLGEETSKAVIDAMITERKNEVVRYKSRGEALARAITSRAISGRDQIIAFAERKAKEIRTAGYREAAQSYAKFRDNPQLAMYLRYLTTLRSGLSSNATIWLDGTKIPAIKYFRSGPELPKAPKLPAGK